MTARTFKCPTCGKVWKHQKHCPACDRISKGYGDEADHSKQWTRIDGGFYVRKKFLPLA